MTPLQEAIEKQVDEFQSHSKRLFTHPNGGLSVLLDYPPHDRVLDDEYVTRWLRTALTTISRAAYLQALEDTKDLKDAAEMLWVVLANVSGSDWSKQSQEWQDAAARWRDNYFAVVSHHDKEKVGEVEEIILETIRERRLIGEQ